mgnify:CR=1 FL=1
MNCLACKHPNDTQRNYCGACGLPLARYCAGCGFRNGAADRYCGGCGAGLEAARRAEALPAAAAPAGPSGAAAAPGAMPGLAELLEAARESVEPAPEEADAKVSQDDIDNLFGV